VLIVGLSSVKAQSTNLCPRLIELLESFFRLTNDLNVKCPSFGNSRAIYMVTTTTILNIIVRAHFYP
jgi:hypothetical protein